MVSLVTDVGNTRSINEDYADFFECEAFGLYVVADGMGGHNAGEIASHQAVEYLIEFIKNNYKESIAKDLLYRGFQYTNSKLYNYSLSEEDCFGMGTTLTACLVYQNKVYIGHIGDSACYGIRNDQIVKLTKDHSLVQELVDSGAITEEEAQHHPRKNVITKAIGTTSYIEPEIIELDLKEYEVFVLCTDGLTNDIDKSLILSTLRQNKDFNKTCNDLLEMAKCRGGRDNITVLIFEGENKYGW